MKPRKLNKTDLLITILLFVAVTAWAFAWKLPYPHPSQWAYVASMAYVFRPSILAFAGHFAIGSFAAFVYLAFCSMTRSTEGRRQSTGYYANEMVDIKGNFMYTRFSPLCGALCFALASPAWRAAQYLSPGFLLVLASVAALVLWRRGGGGRNYAMHSTGMLVASFVCGVTPVGFALLIYMVFVDVSALWKLENGLHEKKGSILDRITRSRRELMFEPVIFPVGFMLGAYALARVETHGMQEVDLSAIAVSWWKGWYRAAVDVVGGYSVATIFAGVVLGKVGLAIGRRIREARDRGVPACMLATFCLLLLTIGVVFRSVDCAERQMLRMVGEYVKLVADDAEGVDWLFTDGRLDDAIKFELEMRGGKTVVLDTTTIPSGRTAERLRMLAPEVGDRDVFEAGGAEVLRAWARERPYLLEKSAWQLGAKSIDRYGKVRQATHGLLLRTEGAAGNAEADARCVAWSERLAATLETRPFFWGLFGGVDKAVSDKMDAIAWRTARMADSRAARCDAAGDAAAAERERELARRLDTRNAMLRKQGELLDQMLKTGRIVLTADEALGIALKRADFDLARHYAVQVLSARPGDSAANFALGMAELEAKDYVKAARHFEKALDSRPNEPATLNNLAIAYVKQGKKERALECAEAAARILPNSPEIRHTLEELRK